MAEDKRIRKTKRYIKQTLIEILTEKPFEQITVTELCKRSDISRITFYAHYNDKFALVDEMFAEMLESATRDYRNSQKENNPANDTIQTFCNLLDCIFNLYNENMSLLTYTTIDKNPYLYYMFYSYIVRNVELVIIHRDKVIKPKYSIKQVSGFICNSLWAFIIEAQTEGSTINMVRKDAKKVLTGILEANIVTEMRDNDPEKEG
ncbi:transcriptional regulator, TetR family [Desulfitobacterium hafniense DCB-2]|uniref:Transcriptional regulator, TetR family n=2 Tax=root TaxID=1 RepID=B8FV25_DESHD|nr:TetR/AcrR family transcriptional regulator [Desulfitobacterium hafniense]ACL18671.1 transcriptional regulator, TetR family [Desulfitobacterium hafniense DCB-2]MEA5024214.1 TetR/AcrR family transcriptional regulator [Desulfitobacterium hafniense]